MWERIARFILKFRWILLMVLLAASAVMAWHASHVQLSYEFARAIPTDNPKYKSYVAFRQRFGEDGNLLVIGIQTKKLFDAAVFNDYAGLVNRLKTIPAVEDVLSIPGATNLVKDAYEEKLNAVPVFPAGNLRQAELDSAASVFFNLPFYQGLLYNKKDNTYLLGIRINKDVLNSKGRNKVVADIVEAGDAFGKAHALEMHYSSLPLIHTNLTTKITSKIQ